MFEMVRREEQLDRLVVLLAERDRLDRELAAAVVDAQHSDAWMACGHRSARRFLRAHGRQSADSVQALLRRARLLRTHTATAAALHDGAVSLGALDALSHQVTEPRDHLYARDEQVLLGLARSLPLAEFEVALGHWAGLADQEVGVDPLELRQHLVVQQRLDGGSDLRGSLHEHGTLVLLAALDAYDTGPDPIDDPHPRSLGERRADALVDVAAAAVHGSDGASPSPAIGSTTIVVDVATLAGRVDAGDIDGLIAQVDGRPVAGRVIDRLLCNTWVSAVVVDAAGAVVDATQRSAPFTATQRRLIAARDRRCVFPGCIQPPSRCDAHHLEHRVRGGTNLLSNGVLVCRRHHRLVHVGWKLRREADGAWTAIAPTGRTWSERPQVADERPPPDLGSAA